MRPVGRPRREQAAMDAALRGLGGLRVVHWKVDLPATAGPPAIADADGSGAAAILVACADGWVYCVR